MFSQMCVCQQINTPQRETVRQMAASNNCPDSNHNSFNFFFRSPSPQRGRFAQYLRILSLLFKKSLEFSYKSLKDWWLKQQIWILEKPIIFKTVLRRGTEHLPPSLRFVFFKERKFSMKPVQIVTLLSEAFLPSFRLSHTEAYYKKKKKSKIAMLKQKGWGMHYS